jgi:hypothetical protein
MKVTRLCDVAKVPGKVLHTPQAWDVLVDSARAMVAAGVVVTLSDWATWTPTERAAFTFAFQADYRATSEAVARLFDGVPEPDSAEGVLGAMLDRATEAGA